MGGSDAGADVVAYAYQMGRLDLVTVVLTILALIFTLATVPVFFYLKRRAEFVAQAEAKKALANVERIAESVAINKMETMLPILMAEYRELAQNAVTFDQADQIAEAQDDDADADGQN